MDNRNNYQQGNQSNYGRNYQQGNQSNYGRNYQQGNQQNYSSNYQHGNRSNYGNNYQPEGKQEFCINCGAKLIENSEFCGSCGARKAVAEPIVTSVPSYDNANAPAPKKNTGKTVAIVVAVLIVLAVIGAVSEKVFQKKAADEEIADNEIVSYDKEYSNASEKEDDTYDVIEKEPEVEDEISAGVISGSVYENEFFGFGFELDGWTYGDRADAENALENTSDYVENNASNKELADMIRNSGNYMDMKATHPDGITNVNVIFNSEENAISGVMSEKGYAEAMVELIPSLYEDMGMPISSCEVVEISTKTGKKYGICSMAEMYGVELCIMQSFVIKDDYVAVISVSAIDQNDAEAVYKNYYDVK